VPSDSAQVSRYGEPHAISSTTQLSLQVYLAIKGTFASCECVFEMAVVCLPLSPLDIQPVATAYGSYFEVANLLASILAIIVWYFLPNRVVYVVIDPVIDVECITFVQHVA